MMKYIIAVILFLNSALLSYCGPFAIVENEQAGSAREVALSSIVQKKPVYFKIKDYRNPNSPDKELNVYVQNAFRKWFYNLKQYIKDNAVQGKALSKYSDIIEFGSSAKAYLPAAEGKTANITLHFLSNYEEMSKYCKDGAKGCYQNKNIYLLYPNDLYNMPEDEKYSQEVLLHEIGHIFILDDLYNKSKENYDGTYGSGPENSIMNRSHTLTCDDADGLATALWLTLKKQNPVFTADLDMDSFCNNGAVYHNGLLVNRPNNFKDKGGIRTYTSYCQKGGIDQIVEVNTINLGSLILIKTDNACRGQKNKSSILYEGKFSVVSDKLQKNFLHLKKLKGNQERIFYTPLIKGKGGLNLFVHTDSIVPAFAYILDDNNKLVFLFAHLKGKYNFVYDYPFNEHTLDNLENGRDSEVFVYDRNNPQDYYLYKTDKNLCDKTDKKCREMKVLAGEYFKLFRQYFELQEPDGQEKRYFPATVKYTLSWDKYITDKFRPLGFSSLKAETSLSDALNGLQIKPLKEISLTRSGHKIYK